LGQEKSGYLNNQKGEKMVNPNRLWGIVLLLLFIGNSSFAQKDALFYSDSEPDSGFRGINWGSNISNIKGMKYVRADSSFGGLKIYTRTRDDLNIDGAKLEICEYYFWGGLFYSVMIATKGQKNWNALKEIFKRQNTILFNLVFEDAESPIQGLYIEKEGRTHMHLQGIDMYNVKLENIEVRAIYQDSLESGGLEIISSKIQKQIDEKRKNKKGK
jgi:hypothetical protein